ncbi:PID-CTERM protein-sorting domain-containing protein [Hymenobacter sp. B81]|uniref:PID-CTERM protein-sorting domain-containing protein n=1 Tax=Hymenobacter sp. B81 TaxID=3344878 RepID=UPI0037DC37D1
MMNKLILFFGVLLLLGSAASSARAQGNPGSGGPQPGQPTAVPIDGGASLLLAGGAAYALSRLRRSSRPS